MFEKLDSANRLNDSGAFPYLRSHPLTVERIERGRARVQCFGGAAQRFAAGCAHALMQTRARVLMDTDANTLRRLQQQAAARARRVSARASCLGLRRRAGLDAAARHGRGRRRPRARWRWLLPQRRAEPRAERVVQLLQAQSRLSRGDPAGALKVLDALSADPRGRAAMLLRGQALLEQQRLDGSASAALREITETLQTWVAEHPLDAAAWRLLSGTADAIGQQLRSAACRCRGAGGSGRPERRHRPAACGAAGWHAARRGRDFIEASVIDARLRDLQNQRRQLVIEARGG